MDITQPLKGMNMDAHPSNLDGTKAYSFALNARQESEDGNEYNITNEPTNTLAVNFPSGYKVIGRLNIVDIGKTIYWLANPTTGQCEIGYVTNDPLGCIDTLNTVNPPDTGLPVYFEASALSTTPCKTYVTIVNDNGLNFSVLHPIHDAEYKITNRTVEIYWTDNFNKPRWMDINNPPIVSGVLDINFLSIFPDFVVPEISIVEVLDTGSLKVGSYQFLVAYANSIGKPWSQYYTVTNPTPVWENKESETLSFDTSKAIKLLISNLDKEYNYINIAVVKTVNFTQTFELAATLSIEGDQIEYTYTGNDKTAQPMTREEIYYRSPYYETAGTISSQNKILMLGNLTTSPRINYQPVASAIKLMWQTWRIPYSKFQGYKNGANTANLRSYMRDEVYPFDMVVIEKTGRVSDRFPIPGRLANAGDLQPLSNADASNTQTDPCVVPKSRKTWEVYNTATKTAFVGVTGDPCYMGPWEEGEFAYWESTYKYPDNPLIWGLLANTPIRHHKFPDSTITHIHDNNPGNDIGFEHAIFPIGVKFDLANIRLAIAASGLTPEQQANIAEIRILHGNRRTNKSIQAKGIVYNVGSYKFQDQEFLFANYPFNDTHPDVFLSTEAVDPVTQQYTSAAGPYSGLAIQARLNAFTGVDQQRYSFISPDTSFIHPSLAGQLKLETVEYGKANAHIIHVHGNPRYEIGTQKGVKMAVVLALSTILSYKIGLTIGDVFGVDTNLDISFGNFLPAFSQAYDMINKLIPFEQYGYQYNAVGNYCNYFPVPNNGNKIRSMTSVGYIGPGIETIPGEVAAINNWQRESSVYIRTSGSLPYPWTLGAPRDDSRFTMGSYHAETGVWLAEGQRVQRDISAYYASLKRFIPDQYSEIHSYQALDTGFTLILDGRPLPTVFGGDTFINRFAIKRKLPFFLQNTVGEKDNTDVDYSMLGNVSYPIFYMSTAPVDPRISNSTLALFNTAYTILTGLGGLVLGGLVLGALTGGIGNFALIAIAMFAIMGDIVSTLGIKKVNLDRFHDAGFFLQGVMYLFAYGIPYFFVESDFNCDYRQAINGTWGNFFPNVGTDIPDYWLQEENTSIARDNEYTYNRDLSKQNLEDLYTYLPEDWTPATNTQVHTTRVIYSQAFDIQERENNWLSFDANSYHDFTYNNGDLVSLKAIEQDKVLARFENNTAAYNAYITLSTDNKSAVANQGSMFSTPPLEYSRTDIGYSGTQHHAFCSTPFGHFWVDARRGTVFNMGSQGIDEISKLGMMNWFKENLPFRLLRYYSDYNVDNNYNGAGISMVWDNRFNRLFITKRDYIPLRDDIILRDGKFYIGGSPKVETITTVIPGGKDCCPDGYVTYTPTIAEGPCRQIVDPPYYRYAAYIDCPGTTTTKIITTEGDLEVSLDDPTYFCNASWTVAYSPITKSWVSFYSFIPNWYVEQQEFFQSGIQTENSSLWNHLLTNKSYQTFYNIFGNFEIETVTKPDIASGTLSHINYRTDILRYENMYDWRFMKDITFDKAILYSTTQTTGLLEMHVQRKNNMSDGIFATQNLSSISIPVSQLDNVWRFNKFSDVTKDANSLKPLFTYQCDNVMKELNTDALNYGKPFNILTKQRLKSDWFKIRLINSAQARFKFIFKWLSDKVIQMTR